MCQYLFQIQSNVCVQFISRCTTKFFRTWIWKLNEVRLVSSQIERVLLFCCCPALILNPFILLLFHFDHCVPVGFQLIQSKHTPTYRHSPVFQPNDIVKHKVILQIFQIAKTKQNKTKQKVKKEKEFSLLYSNQVTPGIHFKLESLLLSYLN